jgi:hypothetical protein
MKEYRLEAGRRDTYWCGREERLSGDAYLYRTNVTVIGMKQIGKAILRYADIERFVEKETGPLAKPDLSLLEEALGPYKRLLHPEGIWWDEGVIELMDEIAALNLLIIDTLEVTGQHRHNTAPIINRIVEQHVAGAGLVAAQPSRWAMRHFVRAGFHPFHDGMVIRTK